MKFCKHLSKTWKLILFSSVFLLLFSCQKQEVIYHSSSSQSIPDEQSDSVTVITMNKDIVTMKMEAGHIDRFYERKETFIDSLYLENYDEFGNLESTLKCQIANIDETQNIVICQGDVIVDSENGTLFTPKLTWYRNSDKVLAENGVKLVRNDDVLKGERLRTDLELNNIEIIKVSAEGTVKGGALEW